MFSRLPSLYVIITETIFFMLPQQRCPWCGQNSHYEMVQSHYVCSLCKRAVVDCCDGEQADPVVSEEKSE